MLQTEQLRVRDNQTSLSGAELTKRFLMLDARIHALELTKVDLDTAVTEITNYGLERVNQVVDPFVQSATQMINDVQAELAALQADWADFDAQLGGIESQINRFPDITAADAGKALLVNEAGDGFIPTKVSSAMPKSLYVGGNIYVREGIVEYMAGVDGTITEICASIKTGTSATLNFMRNSDLMATVIATPAGVRTTTISNNTVTWSDIIRIDCTAVSGDPGTLRGQYLTQPN
jgi:prefoldin subunit 5